MIETHTDEQHDAIRNRFNELNETLNKMKAEDDLPLIRENREQLIAQITAYTDLSIEVGEVYAGLEKSALAGTCTRCKALCTVSDQVRDAMSIVFGVNTEGIDTFGA